MKLTRAQSQQWQDEGYLLLRNVIPQTNIQAVRAMFARVTDQMINELKVSGVIQDEGHDLPLERRFAVVAGKHAQKFGRSWRRAVVTRETFDLHYVPALVDVIAELTGTDVIGHPVFNGRPKLPSQQLTVVPWHQDSSYFGDDTAQSLIITCWFPFVAVNESNGCMQVIPGTHREQLHQHRSETRGGQFLELDEKVVDESKAVTLPMQPGDALLFTNLTFHRSLPSTSQDIRWSVDTRYVRDGDFPGAGNVYWPDAEFKWVIRSGTQRLTSFDEWNAQGARFSW